MHILLPLPSRRELERQYDARLPVMEKVLHELQRRIARAVVSDELTPTVKYRIKRFDSLYEKILRRSRAPGASKESIDITDVLGVRVVCPFMEDIARVEQLIRDAFEVIEVEHKGSNLSVREFGYSSVHVLIKVPDDIRESFHVSDRVECEVQLRTILQDAWAQVEHELVYKAELTPLDERLRRKLAALNANLELSDIIFQEIRDYQRAMNAKLMRRREDFWKQLELNDGNGRSSTDNDEEALHTGSDTIDNMLINALHAHNRKDYLAAIRTYSDILSYQPASHVAALIHTHRGMARFAVNDLEGAIEDFTQTIRVSPQTTKAYYYRAVVYRVLKRYDLALADFSRCLEYDPYHIESRIARARLYRELDDFEAASADCEMARRLDPDSQSVLDLANEIAQDLAQQKHETKNA